MQSYKPKSQLFSLLLGAVLATAFFLVVVRGAPGILHSNYGAKFSEQGAMIDPGSFWGNVMSDWMNLGTFILFGGGLVVLLSRMRSANKEWDAFNIQLFDKDEDTLVLPDDVTAIRQQLNSMDKKNKQLLLMQLVSSGVERARANWDAADVGNAISTKAEGIQDAQEADYAIVKYIAWAIPSVGFIGTVLGIGNAMGAMQATGSDDTAGTGFQAAVGHLSMAFNTTFVALVLSLILMLVFYMTQGLEDSLLARARQWCHDRFVLKMYKPSKDS